MRGGDGEKHERPSDRPIVQVRPRVQGVGMSTPTERRYRREARYSKQLRVDGGTGDGGGTGSGSGRNTDVRLGGDS